MEQTELHETRVTPYQLFLTFSWITLSGFGGIMFWARRRLVERERWLTEQQFVELLTLGQLLPGPPGLNLTVMVGYRFSGWTGAAAAVGGFVGWPCLVVIGMGILYQYFDSPLHSVRSLGNRWRAPCRVPRFARTQVSSPPFSPALPCRPRRPP